MQFEQNTSNEKSSLYKVVLIFSLTIAFSSRLGYFDLPNRVPYLFILFWVCLAIFKYFKSHNRRRYATKNILLDVFLRGNLKIKIFIYIYSTALIMLGITDSRFFTSNMQTFINAISAISVFYLFGESAFECSLTALTLAYYIAVATSVISGRFFFEFHDMAFATGLLIIYYIIGIERHTKKDVIWIIVSLFITVAAFKRIEIFALIVILLANSTINLFSLKTQSIVIKLGNIILIFAIYFYNYLALNGKVSSLIMDFNIDVKGRDYYYDILQNYASFSITYLGLGRNALATMFSNEYAYMHVGNLHSDILRMYTECGFVVYFIWIYNYLIHFPGLIKRMFGESAYRIIVFCTWYLFITYFTDNTELYLVTQYFYILVPVHYIFQFVKRKERCNNYIR